MHEEDTPGWQQDWFIRVLRTARLAESAVVEFSPVRNSQDDALFAAQIKDHTVISNPKPIESQFRLSKPFRVGERAHSLLIVDS